MNLVYQIKKWETTHPVWLAVFRVILGVCLVTKGIYFLNHSIVLNEMIENSILNNPKFNTLLGLVITWLNILGGTFITLGLLTRLFAWVQIPILLGAILLVNTGGGGELLFSLVILLLLVLFVIEGGGRVSMDYHIKKMLL